MSALLQYEQPEPTRAEALIQLDEITKTYDSGENAVQALRGVDVAIEKGEFVVDHRPLRLRQVDAHAHPRLPRHADAPASTGSTAKTSPTLSARQLARVRNQKIGFVFQTFNLLPRASILKNVELPLLYAGIEPRRAARARHASAGARRTRQAREASSERALRRPAPARRHRPRAGQRPVADPRRRADRQPRQKTGCDIIDIFEELAAHGETIVLVTHDPASPRARSDASRSSTE